MEIKNLQRESRLTFLSRGFAARFRARGYAARSLCSKVSLLAGYSGNGLGISYKFRYQLHILFSSYQSKGKGGGNFLFLQDLERVYMLALRGDETNCEDKVKRNTKQIIKP